MCGIAGIYHLQPDLPVPPEQIGQMLSMIRHRGPDQFGVYAGEQVGLGNARLSVIDLAGGQQPISNEDGSIWIVFNGEIYNYVELRTRLAGRGHIFATNTDTEVIIHLYEEEGLACLPQLNGQFAFALWDDRQQRLLLGRDQVGICPLFYTRLGQSLYFASEIKALLAAPAMVARPDLLSLGQLFHYWSPVSPYTLFEDVLELPPGHYLMAHKGQIEVNRFWQLSFPEVGAYESRHPQEWAEGLFDLLVDATRLRLRADVTVGAYLSGGLDSSTIAALVRHYTPNRLTTFALTFADPAFDEGIYQRQMADHLATEHRVCPIHPRDIGASFPRVIWHTELPLLRTSPGPMYLLSQFVRQSGLKVVLTGEGADEFLAGYNIFKEDKIRRFWARRPESQIRPLLLHRLYPYISPLSQTGQLLYTFFQQGLIETDQAGYSHRVRWSNTARTQRFFSPELLRLIQANGRNAPIPAMPAFDRWPALAQAQYLEATHFLPNYLLSSQGDRMMMAHGVEGRFPFLDPRLIEYCSRVPPNLKLRALTEKYLLKQAMRHLLPAAIRQRPKQPYRAPIQHSFFDKGKPAFDYVAELLSEKMIRQSGYFNPQAVRYLRTKIERNAILSEGDNMALAGVLSTQLWHQHFIQNFQPEPPLSGADDIKLITRRQPKNDRI